MNYVFARMKVCFFLALVSGSWSRCKLGSLSSQHASHCVRSRWSAGQNLEDERYV